MLTAGASVEGHASPEGHETPYLSVVATARNDDHGGNLLRRMQIFVDGFINQCKRHNLQAELVLVEWNPPEGAAKLAEALRWPADASPCDVRILEVPRELHRRYRHAGALPLYQMIAKNAGIRRARGEFILATNIDVVFSDELMRFIASRQLQKGRLYRVDRTDVRTDVPVEGTLDEQLAYCRNNIIRLCTRDGIFRLTPDGFREREAEDIVPPDSGIYLGEGWFEVERYSVELFRWMRDEAELHLRVPASGAVLALEIEPGPGVGPSPQPLELVDAAGAMIAEWMINGRTSMRLTVPPAAGGGMQTMRFRARTGGLPVPHDPRIMNFRFFRCAWVDPAAPSDEIRPFLETVVGERPTLSRLVTSGLRSGTGFLGNARGVMANAIRLLRMRGGDIFDAGAEYQIGDGWHHLESTPVERYRWASNNAEVVLRFHDGSSSVAMIVEPGPSTGYKPFDLVVRLRTGKMLGKQRIDGVMYMEFPVPVQREKMLYIILEVENAATAASLAAPGDGRILNFRVFAFGRGTTSAPSAAISEISGEGYWLSRTTGTRPAEINWQQTLREVEPEIAEMGRPHFLHLFACGDFQMMSREDWTNVRGYAELDQFSMHLDSLLSYCAEALGITEETLSAPMRVYHVEHDVGTGWTPEGYKQLSERIAEKGIEMISFADLAVMVAQMRRLQAPLIFNLDDWGMAGIELPETVPAAMPVV